VPAGFNGKVEILVVGGGGGTNVGGGGGGGGVVRNVYQLSVLNDTAISVVVGNGGAPGANGSNSSFGSAIAYGGGAGASRGGSAANADGASGGGGAGASSGVEAAGGKSKTGLTPSQGTDGGNGTQADLACDAVGGGGGGFAVYNAVEKRVNASAKAAGNGGPGVAIAFVTDTARMYAGGGGGRNCDNTVLGLGGSDVGGNGGGNITQATNGKTNTGSGGGGGGFGTSGGSGGSGIVIVRYLDYSQGLWVSSSPSVVSVNATTGLATGLALGSANISLNADECNGSSSVNVPVTAKAAISLASALGTNIQTRCTGVAITNIVYTVTAAATVNVTNLPPGVTFSVSGTTLTISGTPTTAASGIYDYAVNVKTDCFTAIAGGTITVNASPSITLVSAVGTDAQVTCVGQPFTTISYSVTGSASTNVSSLPAGLTGVWNIDNTAYTISGTPIAVTPITTYTININGLCGGATKTGTITVLDTASIRLTSPTSTKAQNKILGNSIDNITYATTLATNVTITGLPAGVTGTWVNNVVTISGTPTNLGTYAYTVTTISNGCNVSATGTIIVRNISTNASLANLNVALNANLSTTNTMVPSFNSTTYNYTLNVNNNIDSIRVKAFPADVYVTIQMKINSGSYQTVASGAFSSFLMLDEGANTVTVLVSAENGTTQTYTITVTKAFDPPMITSFTPSSGGVGESITILGQAFNATAANNIVFFGATRAVVTAATTTSITATVPIGASYAPIQVINVEQKLVGISTDNFIPTFSPSKSTVSTTDFSSKKDFATGSNPKSLAVGDLDGDGKPDLVVINQNDKSFSVYRNISTAGTIGTGSFASKVDFAMGINGGSSNGPTALAIADMDGDGKLDLAITYQSSVAIYRNTTTTGTINASSFVLSVTANAGNSPSAIAAGDLDGDGRLDLAITNTSAATLSILINNTNNATGIRFNNTRYTFTTGTNPVSVAIGDINGDGKPDIAVANNGSSSVSVFRNIYTSQTSFASGLSRVNFATDNNPNSVTIGDLDSDGQPDLVVADNSGASVFLNTTSTGSSTISFATKTKALTNRDGNNAIIGNLSGNGMIDLTVVGSIGGSTTNSVSIFSNISLTTGGDGFGGTSVNLGYNSVVPLVTGSSANYAAINDLDGDGYSDLIVLNENPSAASTLSVFRNVSNNSDLSAIALSSGTLSPVFAPSTTTYTVNVSNSINSITVTPTKAAFNFGTITVNGSSVTSGTASSALPLNVGTNTITIAVTAENGTTTSTYTLTVNRATSANADLSAMTLSAGTLSPVFASSTTAYTASVTNATSSITVTPTKSDANATIQVRVNGGAYTAINSGSAVISN
jgi:hypothetical protein